MFRMIWDTYWIFLSLYSNRWCWMGGAIIFHLSNFNLECLARRRLGIIRKPHKGGLTMTACPRCSYEMDRPWSPISFGRTSLIHCLGMVNDGEWRGLNGNEKWPAFVFLHWLGRSKGRNIHLPSSTRLPKLFLLPNDPPTFNFTEG